MNTTLLPARERLIFSLLAAALAIFGWILSPPLPAAAQAPAPRDKAYEINEKGEPITSSTAPSQVSSGTLRLLRSMEAYHKDVKYIHAVFDQVRYDELLTEKVASNGELWYDKPERFRCDYSKPEPMITLVVDNTLYSYIISLKQVDYVTFASSDERDQQLYQLLIGFGFKTDDLLRHYEIHSSADEAGPLQDLKADKLDPALKAVFVIKPRPAYQDGCPFKQMKVIVDKATHLPDKIWYKDPQDASMTLTMKKIELGVKPAPGTFDKDKIFPHNVEYIEKRDAQ